MRVDGGARAGLALVIGAGGAVVGLLPWLTTGARLPLQNLWATGASADTMPRVLLPVSQYFVLTILAVLVVGALVAGLAARALLGSGQAVRWVLGGLLLVQLAAVAQSFAVVHRGLGLSEGLADPRAGTYWAGMLVGTLAATAVSVAVAWSLARGSSPVAAVGLVLASVPVGAWTTEIVAGAGDMSRVPYAILWIERWAPVVVVVIALTWCGVQPLRRIGVWLLALLYLLIVPPVTIAITYALGSRFLRGDPGETIALMLDVLRSAGGIGVRPAVTAVVVAGVLTGLRRVLAARSTTVGERRKHA